MMFIHSSLSDFGTSEGTDRQHVARAGTEDPLHYGFILFKQLIGDKRLNRARETAAVDADSAFVEIDFADPLKPVITPVDFDFASCGHALCIVDTRADHV